MSEVGQEGAIFCPFYKMSLTADLTPGSQEDESVLPCLPLRPHFLCQSWDLNYELLERGWRGHSSPDQCWEVRSQDAGWVLGHCWSLLGLQGRQRMDVWVCASAVGAPERAGAPRHCMCVQGGVDAGLVGGGYTALCFSGCQCLDWTSATRGPKQPLLFWEGDTDVTPRPPSLQADRRQKGLVELTGTCQESP